MGLNQAKFHDGNGNILIDSCVDDEFRRDDHLTEIDESSCIGTDNEDPFQSEGRNSDTWIDDIDASIEEEHEEEHETLRPAVVPAKPKPSAPPVMVSLPFGSWDDPEEDLLEVAPSKTSHLPSFAPTPSMMPAVRAATRGQRRAVLMAGVVVALFLTGGVVLALTGIPESLVAFMGVDPGGGPTMLVDGIQHASVTGGGPLNGTDGQGPSRSAQVGGVGEESESGLGMAEGHAGDQSIDGTGIPTSDTRRVRSNGDVSERSAGAQRARNRGNPLDAQQIRVTVGRNARHIRSCHEREMRRTGMPISQRVVVNIRVARSGVVRSVDVGGIAGTPLGACIEDAVGRWRFPEATGETVFETPFVLAPRHSL